MKVQKVICFHGISAEEFDEVEEKARRLFYKEIGYQEDADPSKYPKAVSVYAHLQ